MQENSNRITFIVQACDGLNLNMEQNRVEKGKHLHFFIDSDVPHEGLNISDGVSISRYWCYYQCTFAFQVYVY